MNKTKKLFLAVATIALIAPSIALAAWWNPLSWFNHWGMGVVDFPETIVVEEKAVPVVKPATAVAPEHTQKTGQKAGESAPQQTKNTEPKKTIVPSANEIEIPVTLKNEPGLSSKDFQSLKYSKKMISDYGVKIVENSIIGNSKTYYLSLLVKNDTNIDTGVGMMAFTHIACDPGIEMQMAQSGESDLCQVGKIGFVGKVALSTFTKGGSFKKLIQECCFQ